jgi:hypothetical protein
MTCQSTGSVGCWYVMMAVAKAIRVFWFPWVYCIALTVLNTVVCLGVFITLVIGNVYVDLWWPS